MSPFDSWLRTPFGPPRGQGPALRLGAADAIKLARDAAADDPLSAMLAVATVSEKGGAPTWIVSSPVMGRTLVVEIDDASGGILRIERVGIR